MNEIIPPVNLDMFFIMVKEKFLF